MGKGAKIKRVRGKGKDFLSGHGGVGRKCWKREKGGCLHTDGGKKTRLGGGFGIEVDLALEQ